MDTIRVIGSTRSLSRSISKRRKSNNDISNSNQTSSAHHSKVARRFNLLIGLSIVLSWLCLSLLGASGASTSIISEGATSTAAAAAENQHQQAAGLSEAELNNIVQQHEGLEANNKLLAEAIISRLMLDNLTGSSSWNGNQRELEGNELSSGDSALPSPMEQETFELNNEGGGDISFSEPTGLEAIRLKKLLGLIQNYEGPMLGSAGLALVPFPALPASQAATMKRAALRMVQQQQQRHLSPYSRNSFDFGLGKRQPEASSRNILRYGDSLALEGQAQPVSQLGKRPSSHRYDFGLGKRVASPAYPSSRYDFGLGKRAPNRIRYDFGLGK